jgi:hypothetical protein
MSLLSYLPGIIDFQKKGAVYYGQGGSFKTREIFCISRTKDTVFFELMVHLEKIQWLKKPSRLLVA